jgi:hypothetical protein
MHLEIFRAGMKAQWDEGGGRVLLGDNRRPAVSRSRSCVLEFGFQLDSQSVHIYLAILLGVGRVA